MGERSFRKLVLGVILLALAVYLYLFMGTQQTAGKIRNAFFVNTPGCRIVAMNVMNPAIAESLREWPHSKVQKSCVGANWFRAEVMDGSWHLKFVLNMDWVLDNYGFSHEGQIDCFWAQFRRTGRLKNTLTRLGKFDLKYPYVVKVPRDVLRLRAICKNSLTNDTLCDEAHYFINPTPPELLSASPTSLKYWDKSLNTKGGTPPISVMIVGLDSVSHLQFLQQMPRTQAYICQKTSHVEFWGYNKVGVNAYPNLIPMLTGLSDAESLEFWDWTRKLDDLPFIWKDYKAAGYNISLGENWALFSILHESKSGVAQQATDHNFHDLIAQVYKQQTRKGMDATSCILEVLMEMNYKLLPHMQRYPFFSFYWWDSNVPKASRFLDERFNEFFRRLNDAGILNNTIIFFMSDHGMIEESQPFLSVLYPAWMRNKYPMAIKNMANNAHSLVTTFDVHETLKDLLQPNSLEDDFITLRSEELSRRNASHIPRGVSLFLAIPPARTCLTSHIPRQFCLCHKQVASSVDNPIAKLSANTIVKWINKLLQEYPVCIPLQLESIVSAQFAVSERQNLVDIQKGYKSDFYTERDIVVRLKAKPGEAYFEGMTRMHKNRLHLIGDVVRLEGNAPRNNDCIQNPVLEPFCYCSV